MAARMEIVPLTAEHVAEAARLFVTGYRAQRQAVPSLPIRHEDPALIEALLLEQLGQELGVAAMVRGRLCGYLIGMQISGFLGHNRGAFSPEWAHAVGDRDGAAIYHEMYAAMSEHWVRCGCLTHAATFLAEDRAGQEALVYDGFGMVVMDALRPLDPIDAHAPDGVSIRQATPADVGLILPLDRDLSLHLAGGPVFLTPELEERDAAYRDWLAQPAHRLWLAMHGSEAIAYMRSEPPGFGIAHVVRDEATLSISGAYTKPGWRGTGVSTCLLAHIVANAQAEGCQRLSVDFESANRAGRHFWLRHFRPVCYSLLRRLDPEAGETCGLRGVALSS